MARYTDLMELKNDTARQNAIRERVSQVLMRALVEEFGEEFTLYIDHEIGITPNAQKVAKFTCIADVGPVLDEGKFEVGACIEVTVKSKKWWSVKDKNGRTRYGVTLADYEEALEKEKGK